MKPTTTRNADIFPWIHISEAFGPLNEPATRAMVRTQAFANQPVCSICAIACGAQWPLKAGATFVDAECPGCGRTAPTTAAGNWTWS